MGGYIYSLLLAPCREKLREVKGYHPMESLQCPWCFRQILKGVSFFVVNMENESWRWLRSPPSRSSRGYGVLLNRCRLDSSRANNIFRDRRSRLGGLNSGLLSSYPTRRYSGEYEDHLIRSKKVAADLTDEGIR